MRHEAAPSGRLADRAKEVASLCAASVREGTAPFDALTGIDGFMGLDPLESRKGSCFRLQLAGEAPLFVKISPEKAKTANEAVYARKLNEAGLSCPKALAVEDPVLVRRFLEGKTASEELDMAISWGDIGYAESLCFKIGTMLAAAHSTQTDEGYGLVLNDLNLRNFIVSGANSLSLIDLADAGTGDQAKDMGGLAVHILTHRPGFTGASEAMADAAYRAYFAGMKDHDMRRKTLRGLMDALLDAEERRRTPGLVGMAKEYMAHLEINVNIMEGGSAHGV